MRDDLDDLGDMAELARAGRERAAREEEDAISQRRPAELAIAWKLFDRICERDPGSVGDKDAIIAAFKECLGIVRHPPADPLRSLPPQAELDDRVPF